MTKRSDFRQLWRGAAVGMLRRGSAKVWRAAHPVVGDVAPAELRAEAYRDAGDALILARALGWSSGVLAAEALQRRAVGLPVAVRAGVYARRGWWGMETATGASDGFVPVAAARRAQVDAVETAAAFAAWLAVLGFLAVFGGGL